MDKYSRGDVYREGLQKCRETAAKRIEELEEKLKVATDALNKIARADTQAWAIYALGELEEKNNREGP